jgi:hypothetical protein
MDFAAAAMYYCINSLKERVEVAVMKFPGLRTMLAALSVSLISNVMPAAWAGGPQRIGEVKRLVGQWCRLARPLRVHDPVFVGDDIEYCRPRINSVDVLVVVFDETPPKERIYRCVVPMTCTPGAPIRLAPPSSGPPAGTPMMSAPPTVAAIAPAEDEGRIAARMIPEQISFTIVVSLSGRATATADALRDCGLELPTSPQPCGAGLRSELDAGTVPDSAVHQDTVAQGSALRAKSTGAEERLAGPLTAAAQPRLSLTKLPPTGITFEIHGEQGDADLRERLRFPACEEPRTLASESMQIEEPVVEASQSHSGMSIRRKSSRHVSKGAVYVSPVKIGGTLIWATGTAAPNATSCPSDDNIRRSEHE